MPATDDLRASADRPESILVVDDDEDTLEILRRGLERAGYIVELAHGGLEAIWKAEQRPFDLVLTDLTMASGDGFTLVKELRMAGLHEGPVLLMSAEDQLNRRVRGLDSGADDFLSKPIELEELCARVRAHLRRAQRHTELKRDSLHDALTGLLNRRGFIDRFTAYAALLNRRPGTLSLLLIDIDQFKSINDAHGHRVGDHVLLQVGRTLLSSLRASDWVGRWGGDEFVILAPEADAETAAGLCRRLRALCPIQVEVEDQQTIAVDLSLGAATWRDGETIDEVLARADEAMYTDKRAGTFSRRPSQAAPG